MTPLASIFCLIVWLSLTLGFLPFAGAGTVPGQPLPGQWQAGPGELDPIYVHEAPSLIREYVLTLEFARPRLAQQIDVRDRRLRQAFAGFLEKRRGHAGPEQLKEYGRILAGIANRCLGQDAVTYVKVVEHRVMFR